MTTETAVVSDPTAKRASPLDGIVVKTPESSSEKTRRYLCGIKPIPGMEHLDRYVGVGPATFGRHSFVWEGPPGPEARQVQIAGVINVLTEKQVEEIQAKLRYRYLRPVKNKAGVCLGFSDIDASDSGGVHVDPVTKEETPRPPRERVGKTVAGDVPLKDYLTMDVVYEDKKVRGRVVTLDEAKRIVMEAEAEVDRPLESIDATFETRNPKVDATLEAMSRSRPSTGDATPIESNSFAGGGTVGKSKNVTGGAGRLPEKK